MVSKFQQGANLNTMNAGLRPENIEVPFITTRPPTTYDIYYPIGKRWIDVTAKNEYYLNDQYYSNTGAGTILQSDWVLLGGNTTIEVIQGDDGNNVAPLIGVIALNGNVVPNETHAKAVFTETPGSNIENIDVQVAAAITSTDVTKVGLAAFNSADFTVDTFGFVSLQTSIVDKWNLISSSQTLAAGNGYICVSPGGALSLLLPAGVKGNEIEVILDGATSWTITVPTGVTIRLGASVSTVTTGTITSTQQGDSISLVAQSATRWNVISSFGNFIVT